MDKNKINSTKTPRLFTFGPTVRRSDTGDPVQLKGVTSNAFRYSWDELGYSSEEDIKKRIKQTKSWGTNSIQLYIDPDKLGENQNKIDNIIDWADKEGMYVVLNPVNDTDWQESGTVSFWKKEEKVNKIPPFLAKRYKDKTNVLFGLQAEPRSGDTKYWRKNVEENISSIKKENKDAVIIVPGVNISRNLDFVKEKSLSTNNIIYDFHDYPYGSVSWEKERVNNPEWNNSPTSSNKSKYEWMLGKYPVMIGEYGKYWGGDYSSQPDLQYIKEVGQKADKHGLHTFAYSIDERYGKESQGDYGAIIRHDDLSLFDKKGNITNRGNVIKNDLIGRKNNISKNTKEEKLPSIYGTKGSLPKIKVEGKNIVRTDTNEPVQMKGVTSRAFRIPLDKLDNITPADLSSPYKNSGEIIQKLSEAKSWGANTVQLELNRSYTQKAIENLDDVISWADKNGMYVYLQPTIDGLDMTNSNEVPASLWGKDWDPNKPNPLPKYRLERDLVSDFVVDLSKRYKDYNNVIYGLELEPKVMPEEWYTKAYSTIDRIRENNPESVVVLNGASKGQNFSYLEKNPPKDKNVALGYMEFKHTDIPEEKSGQKPYISDKEKFKEKYPIFIGWHSKYDHDAGTGAFGSTQNLEYTKELLNEADNNNYHVYSNTLESQKGDFSPLGIVDTETGNITPRGKIIQSNLQQSPPTRFDKASYIKGMVKKGSKDIYTDILKKQPVLSFMNEQSVRNITKNITPQIQKRAASLEKELKGFYNPVKEVISPTPYKVPGYDINSGKPISEMSPSEWFSRIKGNGSVKGASTDSKSLLEKIKQTPYYKTMSDNPVNNTFTKPLMNAGVGIRENFIYDSKTGKILPRSPVYPENQTAMRKVVHGEPLTPSDIDKTIPMVMMAAPIQSTQTFNVPKALEPLAKHVSGYKTPEAFAQGMVNTKGSQFSNAGIDVRNFGYKSLFDFYDKVIKTQIGKAPPPAPMPVPLRPTYSIPNVVFPRQNNPVIETIKRTLGFT